MRSAWRRAGSGAYPPRWLLLLAVGLSSAASPLAARQASIVQPVTLREAIDAALTGGPRLAMAHADSAAARARVLTAGAYPNPSLSLGYSKAIPRYHVELDQSLEYPWVRRVRIGSARAAASAATDLLDAERAAVLHDVEVAYIGAAAALALVELSARNARDGERILATVRARQAAGDASELDVRLAAITAGQLANVALGDSAMAVDSLLALQLLIGLRTDRVEITLADSLAALSLSSPGTAAPRLVAAALSTARSAREQLTFERWNRLPVPSLRVGFEAGDPTGAEPGILPTIGVGIPLPLWNRSRGLVDEARANLARAVAQLLETERLTLAAIAAAERRRTTAAERLARNRAIAADARSVADLSVVAYQEGAFPLATAIVAQQTARDVLRQFIIDLAASLTAEADYTLAVSAGALAPPLRP